MKNLKLSLVVIFAIIFAVSCSYDEQDELDSLGFDSMLKSASFDITTWDAIDFCGPVQYHDLIGGQTILMGSVAVGNDGINLYVKYEADPGYLIVETHLFVGDVKSDDFPTNSKGNPKIGHFPYATENPDGSPSVVYTIPLSKLYDVKCFDIVAHAVVRCEDGACEETAFGAGGQPDEIVLAVKAWFNDQNDFAYTKGTVFAENCSWGPNFGYINLDLENFTPDSYILSYGILNMGTISTDILNDKLVIQIEGLPGYALYQPHLFIGTVDELNSLMGGDGCPIYTQFPYNTAYVEIPLSDLMTESGEAMELAGTRWGFYFNYCVSDCD